ncbi:hypothetical protein SA2016_1995 [Sinomonas atrocyanea]|uniref:DUF3099 domain-containing protein n=1 Tax=Sinomonas atrocyanea TaxID=37927 RepID=A0A126ZZP7_9MICC|nr:DUF3099 domain-containing protein [Sinomonas atrocyanea]AMM32668.1 hypothetical protein SA2016_1995 [Sinomonas atrocyanea]GEB62705.1 hypothetical protein SAT01_01530 [Sinomonas atrocyanea]GGG53924.1 hypothetical protein GCM10007172_01290 [Sinomonas atrocyanea]
MTREQHGREASDRYGEYAVDGAEGAPEVHSITSAAPGHSVDMHQRMVRYAVAMGIRVVCIVALFFLDGWFKLIAVAGAVFLPWVAVVIANAQTKGEEYDSELMDHISYGELDAGRPGDADPAASPAPHGETILGETVDDDPDREEPAGQDQDGSAAPRRTGSESPEAGAA